MKKIGLIKVMAILIGLHFCGVSVYSYDNDSIIIESESDADSESKDSKKEHKLISLHISYPTTQNLVKKKDDFVSHSDWTTPHIEIASPPPDLI